METKDTDILEEEIVEETHDSHNAIVDSEFTKSKDEWEDDDDIVIDLPSGSAEDIVDTLEKIPNVNIGHNDKTLEWTDTLTKSLDQIHLKDALDKASKDEERLWKQYVEHDSRKLQIATPKLKQAENMELTGESAVLRVMTELGIGAMQQVPLWHSGFWVTIKPPAEDELLELFRILTVDKIELGRATHGIIFSNVSVVIYDKVLDFVLKHIYSTTIKENVDLRDHIKTHDIPILIWGLICSMYPGGFQYKRACIADPTTCNHIVEEIINPKRLLWVDYNSLHEGAIKHMSSRQQKSMTLESVQEYQKELSRNSSLRVCIKKEKEFYINFHAPAASKYIQHGMDWVNGIVESVNKVLTQEDDPEQRNIDITNASKATLMRQYGHFVESIEVGSNIIKDPETINENLDMLSSSSVYLTKFIDSAIDYINRTTVAMVGIPTYDCPSCGQTQSVHKDDVVWTNIIPLDVLSGFFTLTSQEVVKIVQNR